MSLKFFSKNFLTPGFGLLKFYIQAIISDFSNDKLMTPESLINYVWNVVIFVFAVSYVFFFMIVFRFFLYNVGCKCCGFFSDCLRFFLLNQANYILCDVCRDYLSLKKLCLTLRHNLPTGRWSISLPPLVQVIVWCGT